MKAYIFMFRSMSFLIIAALSFGAILGSCKKDNLRKKSKQEALEIRIVHEAGESHSEIIQNDTLSYLHYPFAIGSLRGLVNENIVCVALARDVQKRRKIKMKPIAVFRYKEFDDEQSVIIMTAVEKKSKFPGLDKFSDLIIRYKGMQEIIQSWFLNKCGVGCAEYISWENEQYADLIIQQ